jgi:hypothetical protein
MFHSLKRVAASLAVVGLVAMSPSVASANEIAFERVGHGYQVSIAGLRTGNFMAGELEWTWEDTPPAGFAGSFYSYCVDFTQNLHDPQDVTVRSSEGFTNGAADGGGKAAWLFNQYAAGIRSSTSSTANIMAAALQVAIWEAMFDGANDLTTGNFILNTSGAIRSQAQEYLSALYVTADTYRTSVATILDVAPYQGQDQIVARVSEPSTLLFMGVAFLVFAKRMRRQTLSVADRA